jgi:hypothetical protein
LYSSQKTKINFTYIYKHVHTLTMVTGGFEQRGKNDKCESTHMCICEHKKNIVCSNEKKTANKNKQTTYTLSIYYLNLQGISQILSGNLLIL